MILYLDTETTGLYPGNICQLSYVIQGKNSVFARNFFFAVDYVEPGAQAVHGFSVEKLNELSGGRKFADFADEIERDILSADLVITHNTAFDFMFLRKEFERLGRIFTVNAEFCSMKKTVPICKLHRNSGNGYKYPKLSELCEHFGITEKTISDFEKDVFTENSGFHDARFDTSAVFLAINKGMKLEPELSVLEKFL